MAPEIRSHFDGADGAMAGKKTSHHFSVTSKSKCVINALMTLTFK
jgi:hypothetical protein